MYNKIITGVLEPLKRVNGGIKVRRNNLHISVAYRNEKILHKQGAFHNDNIVKIKNESARKMLELINARNPYCGRSKLNYISLFIRSEKNKYPNNVIVMRSGNKYEAFEEDSVLFVEHGGLEFNGETPHVQFEVTELNKVIKRINEAGIAVNVYEELVKGGLLSDEQKSYHLSKIYKPYTQEDEVDDRNLECTQSKDDSDYTNIEIINNSKDNTIIGLGYDEDGYIMSVLELNGKVNVYYNMNEICVTDMINRLNSRIVILQDHSSKIRSIFRNLRNVIHYHVIQGNYVGENFHKSFMQEISNRLNLSIDFKVSYLTRGSKVPDSEEGKIESYLDSNVISYLGDFHEKLVFDSSYEYVKRYFKRILYKYDATQSSKIREVNEMLSELTIPLIQIKSMYNNNIGIGNNSAIKSNMNMNNMENLISNLSVFKNYNENLPSRLNELVFELVKRELSVNFNEENLMKQYKKLNRIIETYVNTEDNVEYTKSSSPLINYLRNKNRIMKKIVKEEFVVNQVNRVEEAYNNLMNEIYRRFINSNESESVKLSENDMKDININGSTNIIYSKQLGIKVNHVNLDTIQVVENNEIINCYTSKEVNLSLLRYLNECELLNYKIEEVVNRLHTSISPYKQTLEIIIHYLITIQSLNEHVRYGISNGWSLLKGISDDKKVLLSILLSNMGLYSPCDSVEVLRKLLRSKATIIVQEKDKVVDGGSLTARGINRESSVTKEDVDKMTKKINDPKLREKIKAIIRFLDEITSFKANTDIVYLCKNNVPPPRFSQLPVVYVLIPGNIRGAVSSKVAVNKFNRNKMVVYVGETGDISARLNSHKKKTNLSLSDYMQNQFMDYNAQLNHYLYHINSYADKAEASKVKYEIDFDNMSMLLLRLKSRKECKVVENKLIQLMFNHPDLFIVLSHRDGKECTVPFVD
ncbi:conserved hypothetical protein [Theileria orientalis strain Shintoku]|uniref:DNA mismatch repair protein MutS-like N-terminal domain-containing protein n=1 Tax=Theileria orientalis strain Shintoku TaxID=869250 RepID=J4C7L0_THEOR|nr:conserved hypothetical protein [Theileria orientalis strain Shintoku]BAM39223.1 conserved hypothetical protein [Theileria orientalis strain Shintoku]|eukprot:XP_009689524.1 conserved hypothetical protein [Theileria orientalis strain Shintoku]